MGKLIDHPDKDHSRIKAETTLVATMINQAMEGLQKKFPEYYFELSFELQRLGKQKFYRIHLKTLKDGPNTNTKPS